MPSPYFSTRVDFVSRCGALQVAGTIRPPPSLTGIPSALWPDCSSVENMMNDAIYRVCDTHSKLTDQQR